MCVLKIVCRIERIDVCSGNCSNGNGGDGGGNTVRLNNYAIRLTNYKHTNTVL